MVELLPSVHTLGTASLRNWVKFCVVPDESERTARVIAVLGSVTPGLIGRDRRVVPRRDLALEDVRDDRRGQLQRLAQAGQVVRHRDRADHDGEVEHRALEGRRLGGGDRRVRARVVDHVRGQVAASLARAAGAVVDRHAGLDRLEGRDGRLLEGGLERRSAPVERAAEGGALLLVPDEGLVVDVLLLDDELDEEHAARATAQTASPAVVTCRLRRRCISGTPYRVYRVWAATSSPVILQTVVCQYSLAASLVPAGK